MNETFYSITVGNIPEDFYPEIAECEAQWGEWKQSGIPTPGSAHVSSAHTSAHVSSAHNSAHVSSAHTIAEDMSAHGTDLPSGEEGTLFAASGSAAVPSADDTHSGSAAVPSADDAHPGFAAVPSANAHKGYYSRGYLPHFDAANIYQFITFRLHDSVPAEVIEQWKQELHWHEEITADSKEAAELRRRIEKYADSGKGACYLRDERIARLVQNALKHFDGERYRLIAWCIMPNHVHVLIRMMHVPLATIVQSWKSYTAHEANKILGRKGAFWMPDYFDRFIRDQTHFNATIHYILQNPVKAGLVDAPDKWQWSGFVPANIEVPAHRNASAHPNRTAGDAAGPASVPDA